MTARRADWLACVVGLSSVCRLTHSRFVIDSHHRYGFVFAYALAWPQEYAHYKHEQEMKLKAGGSGH